MEVGCWAHARRKYHDCRTSDPERSHAAIAWIGRLYAVEREAREGSWDDARLMTARAERSRPALESFKAWLEGESKKVLPKSRDRRGDGLHAVELGGPDAVPRSPVSVDRQQRDGECDPADRSGKEELVVRLGSDRGGKTAATLLSLVQSCKLLGNEPFAYLRDVLDRVSTHPANRIEELLPDRWMWPGAAADRTG